MSVALEQPAASLRSVMRAVPTLTPEASLGHFLNATRYHSLPAFPVQQDGKFCGMIASESLLALLAIEDMTERETALRRPISEFLRPATAVLPAKTTPDAARRVCLQYNAAVLPVVDDDGTLLGLVAAADFLQPQPVPPYPSNVGGMATPFGVYLTNGTLRAGVGDFALICTGALMGLMWILSAVLVGGGLVAVRSLAHLPASPLFDLTSDAPMRYPLLGLASLGIKALVPAVFLCMMRATRLAGYHAAEHQAVHAMERSEPLAPEIVERMPRAHPRCGTNLMAASLIFFTIWKIGEQFQLSELTPLLAALTTLFTWRKLGRFLQERFTTRTANAREIASGIAAADGLTRLYHQSPPSRPRFLRRLWCMGLAQTALGMFLVYGLATWLLDHWNL